MTARDGALDELYQEVILDHYKRPRQRGEPQDYDVMQTGRNPLCGDELTLFVKAKDGTVEAWFTGHGCSISQASASIMVDAVKGCSLAATKELIQRFDALMRSGAVAQAEVEVDELSDIDALAGVAKFPVRIKCAALAWKALELALTELTKQPK